MPINVEGFSKERMLELQHSNWFSLHSTIPDVIFLLQQEHVVLMQHFWFLSLIKDFTIMWCEPGSSDINTNTLNTKTEDKKILCKIPFET